MIQQPENSWDKPQRQSPAAIGILLLKTLLQMLKGLWALLLVFIFRKQKDGSGMDYLWIAVAITGVSMIATVIQYLFYRFHISNGNFIIQSGFFKKRTVTIPIRNILAVHMNQSLWHRLLNVARITLDSSGSEKVEVKIDALQMKKAEELKALLLPERDAADVTESETETIKESYHLTFTDVMKLSLTANHLEAFFLLFAVGINLIEDIQKIFNIDGWQLLGNYADKVEEQKVFAFTILIIFIALLSVIVSVIRTAIKYYNFNLKEAAKGWKISFGLLNRQELIIPFNKIQILSWRANLLRRMLDFWIVHVQSVGHDQVKEKQHIRLPVIKHNKVIRLASNYQQTPVFEPQSGLPIEAVYWKRKVLFRTLPVVGILTGLVYYFFGSSGFLLLLLIPFFAWYHFKWQQHFRWMANEEGIQLYSGTWGRRYTLITWKKIQQIELQQSIYQRRKGYASLKFITAGGNANLFYIKEAAAKDLTDRILYYIESRNESWL